MLKIHRKCMRMIVSIMITTAQLHPSVSTGPVHTIVALLCVWGILQSSQLWSFLQEKNVMTTASKKMYFITE